MCELQDKDSVEILWLQVMYCGIWMPLDDLLRSLKPGYDSDSIHSSFQSYVPHALIRLCLHLKPASASSASQCKLLVGVMFDVI